MLYFDVDTITGTIYQGSRQSVFGTLRGTLISVAASTAGAASALAAPNRYLYLNGIFAPLPWLTALATSEEELSITLVNPPATPPTTATVTVGAASIGVPLMNNSGTLSVQLHETLSSYQVPLKISAVGAIGTTATLGSGSKSPVALQAITPTTSGDPYVIAPVGAGGVAFVLGYAAGTLSLQEQINALSVATAILFHLTFNDLIPQATADAWAKLTLSTNAANALAQISTLLPNIIPILDAVNPAGGSPMPIWTEMLAALSAAQPAFANTNTYLSEIPGLE